MRGVAAEPQRQWDHAIASGDELTFNSEAFPGSKVMSVIRPRSRVDCQRESRRTRTRQSHLLETA